LKYQDNKKRSLEETTGPKHPELEFKEVTTIIPGGDGEKIKNN